MEPRRDSNSGPTIRERREGEGEKQGREREGGRERGRDRETLCLAGQGIFGVCSTKSDLQIKSQTQEGLLHLSMWPVTDVWFKSIQKEYQCHNNLPILK